jgi:hypothetical protein
LLGLSIAVCEKRIMFRYPILPPFLDQVVVKGLRVGPASVDISLSRYGEDVGINVLRREGPVDVVVIK